MNWLTCSWNWVIPIWPERGGSLPVDGDSATPDVLLIGVRAAIVRGDRTAAENYARRLRRDFPNSAQTRVLPQLMPTQGTTQGGAK